MAYRHSPNFWLATGERRPIFDITGLQPAITPYRDLEVRWLLGYPLLAADSALFFGSLASSIVTHHQPPASRTSITLMRSPASNVRQRLPPPSPEPSGSLPRLPSSHGPTPPA